jgi:3-phenylpropionate/trans-cinnamate dioxygenase ferredoxin reductase subunit
MTTPETVVIVGAGLAGAKTAESLRDQGFAGRVVLIGDEHHQPYERPPLSKGCLVGTSERESTFVHAVDWYDAHRVELRLGVAATRIDRSVGMLELADSSGVKYDRLVLATGSSPRTIPVPGAEAAGVLYLRSIDHADELIKTLANVSNLVVIGAGWIGLEVTAAARLAGVAVTVVEAADLPLLRVLGREIAEVFAALHRDHGVDLRFNSVISEITAQDGRATGVRLNDGTVIPADAVLVGVGASPNVALAEGAGLRVDNGVVVDDALRTSDPDIFAVGDVANAFHPALGRNIRVEHWANALKQPAVAATSILGGSASYAELPYFYTDQYDLGMEYVGYVEPGGYDQVVIRGDVAAREFIAFWLGGGRVLAGMNVNVWDVTDSIKGLISSGKVVDVERLSDISRPLEDIAIA